MAHKGLKHAESSEGMDCCNCGHPDAQPLPDPEGVFHGFLEPEAGRYVLYVASGCPFAARPWFVVKFYGLEDTIQIVRTFPSNGEDSWFFKPVNEWEKTVVEGNPEAAAATDEDPIMGATHMHQLYAKQPAYKGKITVPVMYDRKVGEIVSNDSMSMAKVMCGKAMRSRRTKNKDVELLPAEDDEEGIKKMDALLAELHAEWSTKVYKIHSSATQADHSRLTDEFFASMAKYEGMLASSSTDSAKQFLYEGKISFADMLLFTTAIRFDLAYRWRFNIGGNSIQGGPGGTQYPALWNLCKRFLAIEGMSGEDGATRPKDIMTTYWLSIPLARLGSKKSPVPMLPSQYTPTGLDPKHCR